MNAIYFDEPIDDDARRQALYDGALFVYSANRYSSELCQLARDLCEAAFAPHHPTQAQHQLPTSEFIEILADLKPRFIHHPECKRLIRGLLVELGCSEEKTYFDVPRLRTACAGDYLQSGLAYAFKPHRDTWYSPPQCQLNWWLPVYPIATDNGMAFHPNYWDQPVNNSSREFNYQDWNTTGRQQAKTQGSTDTRVQSEALEPMDLSGDIRLVCPPGGLIVFSAAHMHSTVPNSSTETRISIDFRTVHLDEFHASGGARNVDSECSGTTLMDYLRISDFAHVPEEQCKLHLATPRNPEFPSNY